MMKKITTVLLGVASVCCLAAGALIANTPVNVASAEEVSTASVVVSETKYKVSDNGDKMILVTAIQNFGNVYEVGYEFNEGYTMGEGALAETEKYYDSITTHTKQTAADIFGADYDDAKLVIWEVAYAEGMSFNAYAKEGVMVNDKLTIPDEEIKVTTEKRVTPVEIDPTYGSGWLDGTKYEESEENGWVLASLQTATLSAQYVEGMNTLTFKMRGDWGKQGFAGVFKLKVNGVTYSYKQVGDVWGWYISDTRATNIAMYDANGKVVEISTLSKDIEGGTGWPWVTFVISGATETVEIITDNANVPSGYDVANYVTLYAKDFVWTLEEIEEPDVPETPAIPSVKIEATTDGRWNVQTGYENEENGWYYQSAQTAKIIAEYVDDMNTLTFKMRGDAASQGFAGVFKLKVNGVTYSYKQVGGVWGWYDGETAATNIAMYDANGNVVEISTLSKDITGGTGWPWVTFVISGATQTVEIISDNENAPYHSSWGPWVTLYAKDFVWSYVS